MEVNNRNVTLQSQYRVNENASPIKAGDVSQMVIKDRLGNNEALAVMKGQELTVKFEGQVPTSDRVLVEVINVNDKGQFVVKPVNSQASSVSKRIDSVKDLMEKAGFDPASHPDLRDAVKLILSKGGSVSKESLVVLQQFLKTENGPLEQKLETIKAVQQKNIELTSNHLRSVHTALHGKPLTAALTELMDAVDAPLNLKENQAAQATRPAASNNEGKPQPDLKALLETVRQQLKGSQSPANVAKAFLDTLEKSGVDKNLIQQVTIDINKALQIHGAGKERILQALEKASIAPGTNLAQMIASLKSAIQKETNMNNIIALIESSKSNLPASMVQEISAAVQDAQKLQQIGAARLDQALNSLTLQSGKGKTSVSTINSNAAACQSLVKNIQKEASMAKVMDAVQKFVLENGNQTDIDFSPLQNALEKASRLNDQGRELAARKELTNALAQIEKDNPQLQQSKNHQSLTEAEQYNINELLQTLKLDSKNVMVTEITKKLAQLTIDFKTMKQEITRNLDNMTKLLEPNKPISPAPIKQMLESTISKLDKAILKSDFMLYTDMATEKKLLNASSKLAEARNLLSKGDYPEANQIIKEVKGLVDKLVYKPSDVRVQHFVAEQSTKDTFSPKMISQQLEQAIRPLPEINQGARHVFESIRKLGLTHENEVAQSLISPTSDIQEEQHNLKSVLMKMLQTEDAQGKFTPQAEQALSNLTGQQLLNKQDTTGMQNMFLQLPLLLNKQVETVKIFVNSQKQGEKIDWENCSLYFVLETKKLGEVGILIAASNRNLSFTFKNNQERFQEKMEPLAELSKERLTEIGYNVGAFHFKPFTTKEETRNTTSTGEKIVADTPTFTEKGYDFSI